MTQSRDPSVGGSVLGAAAMYAVGLVAVMFYERAKHVGYGGR